MFLGRHVLTILHLIIIFHVLADERELFEEWFQDLQLAVNECFESPESKSDVETSVQRLNVRE